MNAITLVILVAVATVIINILWFIGFEWYEIKKYKRGKQK